MSQTGNQFLSGLMNRVFRANKESRGAAKRRERSLSARRLGMEPLEDRRLLAVDPTLTTLADAAVVSQNDFPDPAPLVELTGVASSASAADGVFAVAAGSFAETTLVSQSESFALTVGSNAPSETLFDASTTDLSSGSRPSVGLPVGEYSEMGWAATLANMLTVAGWGDVKDVVVDSNQTIERQVFDYFTDNFTNGTSSLYYAFGWFANGDEAYFAESQDLAAYPYGNGGNLFPVETGEFDSFDNYAIEGIATEFKSPLAHVKANYLADGDFAVGIEIQYYDASGSSVSTRGDATQARKSWLTLWGVEYDPAIRDESGVQIGTYSADDPRCYKSVLVSDPATGTVESYPVSWNAAKGVYVLNDYGVAKPGEIGGVTPPVSPFAAPYIYSFTAIKKMPGYGEELTDDYEKNDSEDEFSVKSDLGKIDVVDAQYGAPGDSKGNDVLIENVNLDSTSDPIDYYRFELTQTASNSDAIVLEYAVGQINSAITSTLCLCGEDDSVQTLDATAYGYADDRFDANLETVVKYKTDPDTGKTYRYVVYRETIKLAGLPAGRYYVKVDFAEQAKEDAAATETRLVNRNYSLAFRAGYDDVYETNNSFEDVEPTAGADSPLANIGYVEGPTVLSDLVLKQYKRNEDSETDWFRFETLGVGAKVAISYRSTYAYQNDGELELFLYKIDPTDERGYSLVKKGVADGSEPNEKVVDVPDLPAGVYYAKVVGYKGAGNIHYKLSVNATPSDLPDLRFVAPTTTGASWSAPLIVSSEFAASSGTFESSDAIGKATPIYLNFNVDASQTAGYDGAKLALYINGKLVSQDDMNAALNAEANRGLLELAKLKALFGENGYDFKKSEGWSGESILVENFDVQILRELGLFDETENAVNAIAIVVNPQNYDLGGYYAEGSASARRFVDGETVDCAGETLTWRIDDSGRGAFYNAAGQEVEVALGASVVADGTVLTKKFGSAVVVDGKSQVVVDYVVKKELEYNVSNNFATTTFVFNSFEDDAFAPNADPSEVDSNNNPVATNPNLGFVNRVNLTENADGTYSRTLEDLTIAGAQNDDGSYLSDWFKFSLAEIDGKTNYDDFEIRLNIRDIDGTVPDLDLYVYEVVLNDPTASFEDAYAAGDYAIRLVAKSSGTEATEVVSYQAIQEGKIGEKNYYGDNFYGETYFVRVVGFNGVKGDYSLDFANFAKPAAVAVPKASEYFARSSVSTINSVATLDWTLNLNDVEAGKANPRKWTNQYVEQTIVEYKKATDSEWIRVADANIDGTTCKIDGLEADCLYEFRLTAINGTVESGDYSESSTTVQIKTDAFMNEVVYRAVVVGVSDYPGTSADLVSAANDAQAFRDALLADPQWSSQNIALLLDGAATKSAVRAALEKVAAQSDDNDAFVFYFAGSGMSRTPGGQSVGYLKTFGSTTAQYISNAELAELTAQIAAGSKQFILDAGQVAPKVESASTADYDAFVNSLVNLTANGDSDRPAQITVLTSGEAGQVSTTSIGSRSDFSRALVAAMEDAATESLDSDGRVSFAELAQSVGSSSEYVKRGVRPLLVSNDETNETILTNGKWSEEGEFDEKWVETGAIVVTTTVDAVDKHDGKISLREAIRYAKSTQETPIKIVAAAEDGAVFTMFQGSVATFGTRSGVLTSDVALVYSNGAFKTTENCSVEGYANEIKAGATVSWGDFDLVEMVDGKGTEVSDVAFVKYATFGSGFSDNEKFQTTVKIKVGTVLKTTDDATAKDVVATWDEASNRCVLLCEGREFKGTTAYWNNVRVRISEGVETTASVVLNKIVFDESLAGQALTVDPSQEAIVVDAGVAIDGTSAKGTVSFDGQGRASLLKITATDQVSLIGVQIRNVRRGAAIEVAEGAKFELANSLVSACDGGDEGVVSNAGELSLVNVTFADDSATDALVANVGTLEIENSLFGLNSVPAVSDGFALSETNLDVVEADPGFVDAANGDYGIAAGSEAADRGDKTALRLKSGAMLEYDLRGNVRVSYGAVDAGAFEYVVSSENLETPSTIVTTLEDVVDLEDGEISLREAIFYAGSEYQIETNLQEGEIVVAENGFEYEVRDGKFVAFQGLSASESGVFYATEGVYLVDARGVALLLAEGSTVATATGSSATVSKGKLVDDDGKEVAEGEAIRFEDATTSTTGTLSYSYSRRFAVGQTFYANLAAADLESLVPEGATFDAAEYLTTANADGTFAATVQVTTTENNTTTTSELAITFVFKEGATIVFRTEGSDDATATIVKARTFQLEDGDYELTKPIYDAIAGETIEIYPVGTILTLKNGSFYDADGAAVRLPVGTEMKAPTGSVVVYVDSSSAEYKPVEGDRLTLSDGAVRQFKSGTTVYETERLGTTIGFDERLKLGTKTISLAKGALVVDRAITLDASVIGGLTIDAGDASRVFTIDSYREGAASDYVVLNNLTLQNGSAEKGGLIYVAEGSNVRLSNAALEGASATDGGAIYNAGRLAVAANVGIFATTALEDGGAIYNVGTATIEGEIGDVAAENAGGAIYNAEEGTISLVGATIRSAAAAEGGAIYNAGTVSATKNASISFATALEDGGAIYNVGSLVLGNASISFATALEDGGAIYSVGEGARVSATAATFSGNVALGLGGAVYTAADFFATRSVFADNEAEDGAAVAVEDGATATVVNSLVLANDGGAAFVAALGGSLFLNADTIYGNKGDGIALYDGNLTAYNSIVGGSGGIDIFVSESGLFDVRYNMVETSTEELDATNITIFDPAFRDVSGDDWSTWNLRLSAGSAAIDVGSAELSYYYNFNGAKTTFANDFADSSRPNGIAPDMGAYEINNETETPSTVVTTLDDVFDPYDGLISLREAVAYASTGNSETDRTVTFSADLFDVDPEAERVVYLNTGDAEYEDAFGGSAKKEMGAIFIQGSVIVTTAYENASGETAYRNVAIDGRGATSLFVKVGAGDAELRGLTLRGGYATGENPNGGAITLRDGSLSVVDSFVVGNRADGDGGAVRQDGGSLFVVDSLFAGNSAGRYGGALSVEAGRAYVYNTTIADNEAALYGGVILGGVGVLTLANSVVAQNGGAQNCDVYVANGNLNAVANLIGAMDKWANPNGYNGNYVGLPESPLDPLFVGGDASYGVKYALRSESLAVNSGVNAYANGPDGVRLKLDLNAEDRIVGEVVDMGAFESQYRDVPSTVVTTLVDVVDQTDGEISFREALKYAELLGTPITFDLGGDVSDAAIQLDGTLGAFAIDVDVVVDASNVPGGVEFVGDDSNIFRVGRSGSLTLTSVRLTGGNAALGGAIYMEGGSLSMTNCVVYGNEATTGGAIYVATKPNQAGAYVKLLNTTIAGNDAENFPGVYFGSARGTFELQNSIIAENATETSIAVENYDLGVTGILKATASVVGIGTDDVLAFNGVNGVSVGTVAAPVDPGFQSSASNDFSLVADSIAVNSGSNRMIGQAGYYSSILLSGSNVRVISTDILGNDRLIGGTVDMGAYEYQVAAETPSVVVTTLDDVVDAFDGKISLREAIEYAGSAYFKDGLSVKVGRTITFAPDLAGGTIRLTETLDFSKCVSVDATGLVGGLTVAGGNDFGVFNVDAQADSVASEVVLAGLNITGGNAKSGAGVYHVGGKLTMLNCVVYGNAAEFGAGVRSDAGTLNLVNVTITKNAASLAYGGVYSIGGSVVLRNALIAQNKAANGADGADVYLGSIAEMRSSLVGVANVRIADDYDGRNGNFVGTAAEPVDPSFVDWAKNDFSLGRDVDGFNSVAINSGDNVLCVYPDGTVPGFDANGDLRFVGGTVDIGALESKLGPIEMPSLIVTTAEDVVDPYDGLISLREAVAYADNYSLEKTITFAASINGSTLYLNEALTINADLTIDGLADGSQGFVLTTADSVNDQRIIYVNNGDVSINGLTITNRRFERLQKGLDDFDIAEGGAIYVRAGSISIYNSLISDNAAGKGSALYVNEANSAASAKLVNCTVVDNTSLDPTQDGAAICAPNGTLTIQNTIVAGNDAVALGAGQTATDVYVAPTATAVANNVFVSYSDSLYDLVAGQTGCFVGGSKFDLSKETDNLFVDVDNRDYRLNDDSLATNTGNNAFLNPGGFNGSFDSFDVSGERRVYYTTVDMGAFENQSAKDSPIGESVGSNVSLYVTTERDVVDPTDGVTSLREALALGKRMNALGFDISISIVDDYAIKVDESCFQIDYPVSISGGQATIDCGYSNCGFLVESNGVVRMSNLIIANGSALQGAGIQLLDGDLVLNNVLIYGCEASVAGGAIYSSTDGSLSLFNATVAKNVSARGAGIYATGSGALNVVNSIVATNRSTTDGYSSIDLELANVVQATPNPDASDLFVGSFDASYSLVGNVATQGNADYILANGTESKVGYGDDASIDPIFLDASGGDFRLFAASPAYGSASRAFAFGRSLNDVYLSVLNNVNMGGYQAAREDISFVVTTLEDVVDPYDGLISLREAIQYANNNVDVIYGGNQAGSGHINDSAYNAANALNDDSVYDATYYSPITFDKSLAGGTIVLKASVEPDPDAPFDPFDPFAVQYGGFEFDGRNTWDNTLQDYMIDASALANLGGITIDASALREETLFSVRGSAAEDVGIYRPAHLDLRGLKIVGGGGTCVQTNAYAMISMRDCLVSRFGTALNIGDDDSNDGSIAHIYSSTFANNRSDARVGGVLYTYNSIMTGGVGIVSTQANPGYRRANYYYSYIQGTGGLGRHNFVEGNVASIDNPDELFVGAANGDYRLATYSVCVNAGGNDYRRTLEPIFADGETDLNGNARVLHQRIDVGAYENPNVVDQASTVVSTLDDVVDPTDGKISIREALIYAQQRGATVTFDSTLNGQTLVLTEGPLQITRNVSFNGTGSNVTLSAGGKSSIFEIDVKGVQTNVANVSLTGLTLTGGATAKNGGAVYIANGNVWMNAVDIYGCSAAERGGAIYAYDSELRLVDCKIGGNTAAYYGGVVNQFGRTVLQGCYIAENVGLTANSDVWGRYPANFSNSKNNVVGFVKDIYLYDGVDGNKIGTQDNPIKPFVSVKTGDLTIKPEDEWRKAVAPAANANSLRAAAFEDFEADGFDGDLEVKFDSLGANVFDDDLFDSLN